MHGSINLALAQGVVEILIDSILTLGEDLAEKPFIPKYHACIQRSNLK
jgi:hypothetical protein